MRISDWSSDVCSSDLVLADPYATYAADLSWSRSPDTLKVGEVYYVIPYEYKDAHQYRDYVKGYILPQFDGWMKNGALTGYEMYMNRYPVGTPWAEIGRASLRERVCQYV